MKKKYLIIVAIIIILSALLVGCGGKGTGNVLSNGNFESAKITDKETTVNDWTLKNESFMKFKNNINDGSEEYIESLGTRYAYISAQSSERAFDYMFTKVKLQKNKIYKLSADIKVDKIGASGKVGAKVSFLEDESFVGINIVEANEEWTNYEYYFTCTTSKEVSLYVGLGNATNNVYGEVGFDNIVLEKVDEVPSSFKGSEGMLKYGNDYTLSDAGSITTVVILSILSGILLVCAYFGIRAVTKSDETISIENEVVVKTEKNVLLSGFAVFCYILCGAFLIRFLLAILTYGMGSNVDALSEIGKLISSNRILSFYPANNSTAPIGIVYIMGLFGTIAESLGIEIGSLGYSILTRTPSIIMDVVTVFVIYSFASKYQSEKHGLIYAAIYAFVPLFWTLGAFYASWECVTISLLIIMAIAMLNKNYIVSTVTYTLALMFSHYALLILPIILLYQIYAIVTDKENRINVILVMVMSFVFFYAMTIPPCLSEIQKGNVFYYFKCIFNFFKSNAFLNQDTFNLYAIFGMANKTGRSNILETFNWMFVIALSSVALIQYLMRKNRLDLILSSAFVIITYALLGANAQVVILPIGLALLFVYIILVPDTRLFAIFSGLSVLSFINLIELISRSGYITGSSGAKYLSFANNSGFLITFSVFALLLAIYFIYVVIDILFYSNTKTMQPLENGLKGELKMFFSMKWLKKTK